MEHSISNIKDFTINFIYRLRSDERIKQKPSLRQAIGLIQFLISRYFRLHRLRVQDLIEGAILSTYFEYQTIAKEIALEILFPGLKRIELKKKSQKKVEKYEHNKLNELLEQFQTLEQDLDFDMINKSLLKYEEILQFFEKNIENQPKIRQYMEEENLISELFRQEISNLESFNDFLDKLFTSRNIYLNTKDLSFFHHFNRLSKYISQIDDLVNQISASYLLKHPEWKNQIDNLLKLDIRMFGNALNSLKKLGLKENLIKEQLNKGINNCRNLQEYLNLINNSEVFGSLPQRLMQELPRENLSSTFNLARNIDEKHDTKLLEDIFNASVNKEFDLNVEEIISGFNVNNSWKQAFHQFTENNLKNRDFLENFELLDELNNNINRYSDPYFKENTQNEMKNLAHGLMENIKNPENFIGFLKYLVKNNIPFQKETALIFGKKAGCSSEMIFEVIGKSFDLILRMIDNNVDDFQRYNNFLSGFPLNQNQYDTIIQKAVEKKISSLLGVLGHKNFNKISSMMESKGFSKNFNILMEGMGKGPGENLLFQWYLSRNSIPLTLRERFLTLAKSVLIEMTFYYAKNKFGFIKNGRILETNELRIYYEGDTMENINIEETVDNIITKGKTIELLNSSDIICKKEKKSRIKVILIIDVSGSMSGKKFLLSTLASCILLYLLSSQDFSLVIFESNTHIIKKFDEDIELDILANELLNIEPRGGTRFNRSLEYINATLENIEAENLLITFLFSDLEFFESKSEILPYLEKLQQNNFSLKILTTEKTNLRMLSLFEIYLNAKYIKLNDINNLTDNLSLILYEL